MTFGLFVLACIFGPLLVVGAACLYAGLMLLLALRIAWWTLSVSVRLGVVIATAGERQRQ